MRKKNKLPFFFFNWKIVFGNSFGRCESNSNLYPSFSSKKGKWARGSSNPSVCLLEEFLFQSEAFSPRNWRCSVMVYFISIVKTNDKMRNILPLNILFVKPDRMVAVSRWTRQSLRDFAKLIFYFNFVSSIKDRPCLFDIRKCYETRRASCRFYIPRKFVFGLRSSK